MRPCKHDLAFTLIELMVVIVIIGILAAIAVPSYRKYIVDSKIAEAYVNIDALSKSQISYFANNNNFFTVTKNPDSLYSGMKIESNATWDQYGYSIAQGTNVYFSYAALAGGLDEAGLGITGVGVDSATIGLNTPTGACRDSSPPSTFGAVAQNNFRFVEILAQGDLDGTSVDQKCTVLVRIIQTDPANNTGPTSTPVIIINKGH